MRFLLSIFFTGVLIFAGGFIFPWWWIAIAAALIALVWPQHPLKSFLGGLLGGFLTWFGLALLADHSNNQVLSTRMAAVFTVNSPFTLVLLSGVIGGLVAGMAALSIALLRSRSKAQPAA